MQEFPDDPTTWTPQQLAFALALEASESKAEDVCVLDVGELLYVTEWFVLATTHSSRQTKAIADSLNELAKKATGSKGRVEGTPRSSWLLIDLGNVVVHVLTEEAREFYGLDALWADADRYELSPESDETDSAEEQPSAASRERDD